MPTSLPKVITSYDLLKSFALILMIIDHTGLYFFPDEIWFRIVGRLCVPIWFFLIGYAQGDEVPKSFWMGGIIILLSAVMSGQYVFPLNILFMLAAARYLRGGVVLRALYNPETLRGMFLILSFAAIPSGMFLEYGSLGMLFVVMGYFMRNWPEVKLRIPSKYLILYIFMSFAVYWLLQGAMAPEINAAQISFLTIGLIGVGILLFWFRPMVFPGLTGHLGMLISKIIMVLGRHTLGLYVLHIVIFRIVCLMLYPDRFPFMELKIVPANMLAPIL